MSTRTYEERQALVTLRKVGDMLLAYTPVVICVVLTFYTGMRAFGYTSRNIVTFFANVGLFWAPYLFIASLYRGFCRLHRIIIAFDLLVGLLIYVELWLGFPAIARLMIDICLVGWGLFLQGRVVRTVCRVGFIRGPWHKCDPQ